MLIKTCLYQQHEDLYRGKELLKTFWRLVIIEEYSAVRTPPIEANNFELKPALITMMQQNQFIGHPSKDPNEHLGRFMRMANTVKMNGVNLDVMKLELFPFFERPSY